MELEKQIEHLQKHHSDSSSDSDSDDSSKDIEKVDLEEIAKVCARFVI